MAKLSIYSLSGKIVAAQDLSSRVFLQKPNLIAIAQAVDAFRSNNRSSIANSKTRSFVSGGGRKPFKQKGTGNARAGSSRSPLWIGGGITFGPSKNRNWKKQIPQNINNLAIRSILSEMHKNKKIIILKDFKLPSISTKQIYEIFSKLPMNEGKILVILPKIEVNAELSLANIPYATIIKAENINVFDLLKSDFIISTKEAIEKIEKILTGGKEQPEVKK